MDHARMRTPLSPNFTLEELTVSDTALRLGIDNTPGYLERSNLERLATTLLEPIRSLLAVPLHVNSGYRAPRVNAAVGGSGTSAHMSGRAADLVPVGMDLREAFDRIRASALPFDQLIFECAAWIHVGIATDAQAPRRQVLTATGAPGRWHYVRVS